jgi:sec-independent protein translocase protein TatA
MGDLLGKGGFVLIVIAVVVFGSKRLPDAAKNLGKSIRIFKNELEPKRDDKPTDSDSL